MANIQKNNQSSQGAGATGGGGSGSMKVEVNVKFNNDMFKEAVTKIVMDSAKATVQKGMFEQNKAGATG